MWMLPLYLHVNQKSDYDMMKTYAIGTSRSNVLQTLLISTHNICFQGESIDIFLFLQENMFLVLIGMLISF